MKNKNKSKYQFIVTAPDKLAPGGVSLFCRTLNKYMSSDFYFFYRKSNSYPVKKNIFQKMIGQLANGLNFLLLLTSNLRVKAVVINVSFNKISLIRELYYTTICKLFQKPTIFFFHGWNKSDLVYFEKKGNKLLKFILSNCLQIFVLSEEFKNDLLKIKIKNPIIVTTTMFDESDIIKPDFKKISTKYAPGKKDFNIVFLSRIEREKGIYEAIEVTRWLNSYQTDYRFTLNVVGDGKEFKNVIKYEDTNFRFYGFLNGKSKFEILNNGDLFLFPTFHGEGFPITITEAMACGLPIFTRSIGGIKDFFKPSMGFCTESLNPEIFGRAILDRINSFELSIIAEYNYNYAWENFAASKYVRYFEDKIMGVFRK